MLDKHCSDMAEINSYGRRGSGTSSAKVRLCGNDWISFLSPSRARSSLLSIRNYRNMLLCRKATNGPISPHWRIGPPLITELDYRALVPSFAGRWLACTAAVTSEALVGGGGGGSTGRGRRRLRRRSSVHQVRRRTVGDGDIRWRSVTPVTWCRVTRWPLAACCGWVCCSLWSLCRRWGVTQTPGDCTMTCCRTITGWFDPCLTRQRRSRWNLVSGCHSSWIW